MLTQSSLFQQLYTGSIELQEFLGSFEPTKLLLSYNSAHFPKYNVVALDKKRVPRVTESATPGMKLALLTGELLSLWAGNVLEFISNRSAIGLDVKSPGWVVHLLSSRKERENSNCTIVQYGYNGIPALFLICTQDIREGGELILDVSREGKCVVGMGPLVESCQVLKWCPIGSNISIEVVGRNGKMDTYVSTQQVRWRNKSHIYYLQRRNLSGSISTDIDGVLKVGYGQQIEGDRATYLRFVEHESYALFEKHLPVILRPPKLYINGESPPMNLNFLLMTYVGQSFNKIGSQSKISPEDCLALVLQAYYAVQCIVNTTLSFSDDMSDSNLCIMQRDQPVEYRYKIGDEYFKVETKYHLYFIDFGVFINFLDDDNDIMDCKIKEVLGAILTIINGKQQKPRGRGNNVVGAMRKDLERNKISVADMSTKYFQEYVLIEENKKKLLDTRSRFDMMISKNKQ